MFRFSPHLAPFLLVREQLPLADQYRRADASVFGSVEESEAEALAPAPVEDSEVPAPVCDDGVPTPDPLDDADALEELEEEISILAAHIHAATHKLLTLIAEFDRRRGWELGGHRSAAHWLSFRTGIDLGAAQEKVRTARVLANLPQTSASMARGELSFSQVRALSRVATEANEGDLIELARECTTAQLERMVRAFRRGSREDEAALEERRHQSRTLSVFPDEDGMYVVKGRLPAEVGALLMRAVEAASDALFREEWVRQRKAEAGDRSSAEAVGLEELRVGTDSRQAATQRRADALGLLAERALVAGFEAGPISGTRAERYQVFLHVDSDTLESEGEPGRSELEDGTRLSAATSQRLSCDTGLVRISHAPGGSVLDIGRRTRTISPALRRALEVRDRGCRFPGCSSRFTDAHHVRHWADGGETSLGNTLLVCKHHHRLVHEGGWRVVWWGSGRPVFFDPRGGTHFEGRWQPHSLDPGKRPAAALVEENQRRGVRPDGRTAGARWEREADIPDRVYFRAVEALRGAGS